MWSSKLCALLTLTILASCPMLAQASPDIIYSDSQDGHVTTWSGGAVDSSNSFAIIGDNDANNIYRAFFKFSLSGISGALCVVSARLYVYLYSARGNGVGPYPGTPGGVGDAVVRHIGDYGNLDYSNDFNLASIGNDPGTLIPAGTPFAQGYLSMEVTTAMQDDISDGRAFTSFMIKMSIDTDNDGIQDTWMFRTSEIGTSQAPYIDYTLGPCPVVGGVVMPTNTLAIVAPWLVVIGLIGCIGVVVVVVEKKRAERE